MTVAAAAADQPAAQAAGGHVRAATDPKWSMAIIRDNDDKSVGPYGVGSQIRDATIDLIEETRAYLDFGGGRREYLELLDVPATRRRCARARPRRRRGPKDPLAEALDKGIKKTGPNSYEVQHATLDALLGNMGALSQGGAHRSRDEGRKIGGLPSALASGPTGRSGRSACRTATSSQRSTVSR